MSAIDNFISITVRIQAQANKQFERLSKLALKVERRDEYILTRALSRVIKGYIAIFRTLRSYFRTLAISRVVLPPPAVEASTANQIGETIGEVETQVSREEVSRPMSERHPLLQAVRLSSMIQSMPLESGAFQFPGTMQTEVMTRLVPSTWTSGALPKGNVALNDYYVSSEPQPDQLYTPPLLSDNSSQGVESPLVSSGNYQSPTSYFSSPMYALMAGTASLSAINLASGITNAGIVFAPSVSPISFVPPARRSAHVLPPPSIRTMQRDYAYSRLGIRSISPNRSSYVGDSLANAPGNLSQSNRGILWSPVLALVASGATFGSLNVFENIISQIEFGKFVSPFRSMTKYLTYKPYLSASELGTSVGSSAALLPVGEGSALVSQASVPAIPSPPIPASSSLTPNAITTLASRNGNRRMNYAQTITPKGIGPSGTTTYSSAGVSPNAIESSVGTGIPVQSDEAAKEEATAEETSRKSYSYLAPVMMLASAGVSLPIALMLKVSQSPRQSIPTQGLSTTQESGAPVQYEWVGSDSYPYSRIRAEATYPSSNTESVIYDSGSTPRISDSSSPSKSAGIQSISGTALGLSSILPPAILLSSYLSRRVGASAFQVDRLATRGTRIMGESFVRFFKSVGTSTLLLNRYLASQDNFESRTTLEGSSIVTSATAQEASAAPPGNSNIVPGRLTRSASVATISKPGIHSFSPIQPILSPQLETRGGSELLGQEERRHPVIKVQGIYDSNAIRAKTSEEEEMELRELRRKMASILEDEFRRTYGGT